MSPGYRQCAALLSISADVLADFPIKYWQVPSSAEKLLSATAAWATEPARRHLVQHAATCLLLSDLQLPQVGMGLGQRVVTEAPDIPLGYWVMTSAYDGAGDSEKGLSTVQSLVEKFSDLVSARDSLVQRLIDADRMDDAEIALAAWMEAGGQPQASFAWSKGSYLLAQDKRDDSIAWLEKCLNADPGFVPAKAKLVELLVNHPLPDGEKRLRVIDWARQLVQGDSRNFNYRMMLGWALALDQQLDEGLVYLNAALTGMPRSAELHYRLGRTYEKQGQAEMAKLHYGQAMSYGLEDGAEAEAAAEALEALADPVKAQPETAPTSTQPAGAAG
jgi:tetratricopeptide (TPR) repeat protein